MVRGVPATYTPLSPPRLRGFSDVVREHLGITAQAVLDVAISLNGFGIMVLMLGTPAGLRKPCWLQHVVHRPRSTSAPSALLPPCLLTLLAHCLAWFALAYSDHGGHTGWRRRLRRPAVT